MKLLSTPEGVRGGGRWVEGEVPVWCSLCGLTLPFLQLKKKTKHLFFKNLYHFPVLCGGPSQGCAITLSLWLLEAILLLSWGSPECTHCFTGLFFFSCLSASLCADSISGVLSPLSVAYGTAAVKGHWKNDKCSLAQCWSPVFLPYWNFVLPLLCFTSVHQNYFSNYLPTLWALHAGF